MVTIYLDKQVFSHLFKGNEEKHRQLREKIYKHRDEFIFLYSEGHILDLQNGAHDPSRKKPRGGFLYMHICSKGVDFCSKGRELWPKGGVLCPLNIGIFSNSLADSQLQNLTMFEGLKNLPFEQKSLPFEHLGRIVLSGC